MYFAKRGSRGSQRDTFPFIHLLMKNEHQVPEAFNDVRFLRIPTPSDNEGMRITCFAPNSTVCPSRT